jgi:uncharacterized membrane protein
MPTLVVAPALTCVQWCAQFSQYAPELSNTMLYCTDQKKSEASLLHMDVIIVNSTSHLLDSVAKRVRRVIVDESHLTLLHRLRHLPPSRASPRTFYAHHIAAISAAISHADVLSVFDDARHRSHLLSVGLAMVLPGRPTSSPASSDLSTRFTPRNSYFSFFDHPR